VNRYLKADDAVVMARAMLKHSKSMNRLEHQLVRMGFHTINHQPVLLTWPGNSSRPHCDVFAVVAGQLLIDFMQERTYKEQQGKRIKVGRQQTAKEHSIYGSKRCV